MSEATHSPLPWRIENNEVLDGRGLKLHMHGVALHWAWDAESVGNDAFIVRAANAHYALVAACEAILETNGLTDKESEAREKARSALALARGEK